MVKEVMIYREEGRYDIVVISLGDIWKVWSVNQL